MAGFRIAALVFIPLLATPLHAQDPRLAFTEAYALADDRGKLVSTLLDGSEEWFEYNCREKQAHGEFAAVVPLLEAWTKRYGRGPAVIEAESRQALLNFAADPNATFGFLRQRLGLRFDDQPDALGERGNLPTRLDPALISREAWSQRARAAHPLSIDGFSDSALFWLGKGALDDNDLRALLKRLDRPDLPGLPALIVRELGTAHSKGFGALDIHSALRLEQLEECARLEPGLLKEPKFVAAWLKRLAPGADSSWSHDPAERKAVLARYWNFVRPLAAVHNSLKAHVLYHLLAFDLSQGVLDEQRFLEYLRLPCGGPHNLKEYRDRFDRKEQVDPKADFATVLDPIGDDEAIVLRCLQQIFARQDRIEAYAEFLDADWLRRVLAETRLVNGDPDTARWTAMLGESERVDALARRVEIEFPPTMPRYLGAHDPVVLEADVKNVPTLLVKVFAIDAFRYHTSTGKEVDESIELDGLVANYEQTFHYDESPMRRVRRRFELPILTAPGTYVVELVGNGLRGRAVIEKGFLRFVEIPGAAGHVFTVFDDSGARLTDAGVWTGGREYRPDAHGEVIVPYSSDPGRHVIVLHQGERSTLWHFQHAREEYELSAEFHLDREALIAGTRARLVVRPDLRLAGRPIALRLLEDPFLRLSATDLDGLSTTQEVRGLNLVDERELVHEFSVPERLAKIFVELHGSVKDLAGKRIELVKAWGSFDVNRIDATSDTCSVQVLRTIAGYAVELRGKDGETRAGRPVAVSFRAKDFVDNYQLMLQTDAAGRIELGPLEGIRSVSVTSGPASGEIMLNVAACNFPRSLHGLAGETLRVPYQGSETTPSRAAFSLLGDDRDAFGHLALANGFLELRDLAAGDYELQLHETGTNIDVRVAKGRREGSWLIGGERMLERTPVAPLAIPRIEVASDELRVQVANATKSTRLTIVATRFLPPFELFDKLGDKRARRPLMWDVLFQVSSYYGGIALGDEYRYVLERRFAPKYPGNMLGRPSLLLNPLNLDEALARYSSGGPGHFSSRRSGGGGKGGGGGGQGGGAGRPGGSSEHPGVHPGIFANLDYLPAPSTTLTNLIPDASGLVRVPLKDLGAGQLVHVLALDGEQAVYDTIVRPEVPIVPRARHLVAALDEHQHSIEQRKIEFVAAKGTAVTDDARTTRVARLDSLAAVHHLLYSISNDADLARFEFVVRWPDLSRAEKLDLYSRHACHELHFFLYQKDRVFFDEVVGPFLKNKLNKTFLDHWLLGDDLRSYLEPWAFGRLNLIEKILLARRVDPAERATIARLVSEALGLLPPDRERLQRLFELALSSDALAGGKPAKAPEEMAGKVPPPGSPAPAADDKALEEKDAGEDLAKKRDEDVERRKDVRRLYQPIEPTLRLIEHDYWYRAPRADNSFAELVPASAFWRDFALADPTQPFVSPAVAEASASFLEMMFALSVIDLPFKAGAHDVKREGTRTTLTAATPLLFVRKETSPVGAAVEPASLLLGENFLRLDERTEIVDGQTRDRLIKDEFLIDTAYACQVVVTNPTSIPRAVELLLQIPAGAVPVQNGFWTRGKSIDLGPYSTQAIEYAFYFPRSGDFAHYPVHASEKDRLAGAAAPRTLHVVDTLTKVDTTSWEHVAQHGSPAEVLAYLDVANVQRLDLGRIAWRLHDREFFATLTGRLRARHIYDDRGWSYGLFHGDEHTSREYLEHQNEFVATCGSYLDSPLLRIDPLVRNTYLHVEFDPLIHPRAHLRGRARLETSPDIDKQYRAFLDVLGHKRKLDAEDWAMVTYYMLLQDRVDDALLAYVKIDRARLDSKLQYEYLGAYLCFFTGDVLRARALAEPYRDHPVAHWRERFAEVLAELDEAAGKRAPATGPQSQDQLAATEPTLELAGEGRALALRYRNLAQCEVRFYPLDVEVAFSSHPFAPADGQAAAFVQPLLAKPLALPTDKAELALALPAQFSTANVLVEVRAGGLTRARTLFANALDVRFLEPYGQVTVADPKGGAPLSKVYVKCFARLKDGTVRFHKDGYTDIRGRFDYASISNDPDLEAERYAVLVLSDTLGATIRELAPPPR